MRRWLVLALFVLAVPSLGYAGSITLSGGTGGTIPSGAGINDFIGPIFSGPIGGFYGSQVNVTTALPAIITIDFFGGEADFDNQFRLGNTLLFDHVPGLHISPNIGSPLGTFSGPLLALALLAFHFDINGPATQLFDGSNLDNSGHGLNAPNFFVSCNPFSGAAGAGGTTCDRLWIFLDDSGGGVNGGGPDDDYDDLVLRVTIASVPEPATLALLGLGLMGGSLLAKKRK